MVYKPKTQELIDSLFPEYLAGHLNKETRHDDYIKLIRAVNEVIRDARKRRSSYIQKNNLPENYLINLFNPLIERITLSLIHKFPSLSREALSQNKLDFKETSVFGIYYGSAVGIFRSAVLGPNAAINPNKQNADEISDSKYLGHSSLRVNTHKETILGKRKVSQEMPYVKFIRPTPEAECAALDFAKRFKAYTPKQNPHWDEPAFFDPDYMKPAMRCLIRGKEMSDQILKDWRSGEYPEFETEKDCINWIQTEFTQGISLTELDQRVQAAKEKTHNEPPNFIIWICGTGKRAGERGFLYERLRQLAYWHIKDERRGRDAEITSLILNSEDLCEETEMNDLLSNGLEQNVNRKNRRSKNNSIGRLWNDDEATIITPVKKVTFKKDNK